MDCITDFFESILQMQDRYDAVLAFSELNHRLQAMSAEEQLRLFEKDRTCGFDCDRKYRVYIAGLAEYLYHLHGLTPPVWVYDKAFYLPDVQYSEALEELSEQLPECRFKELAVEEAIPEFKRRNLMITEVLNAC